MNKIQQHRLRIRLEAGRRIDAYLRRERRLAFLSGICVVLLLGAFVINPSDLFALLLAALIAWRAYRCARHARNCVEVQHGPAAVLAQAAALDWKISRLERTARGVLHA
jgi:hypothetical protein